MRKPSRAIQSLGVHYKTLEIFREPQTILENPREPYNALESLG